MKLGAGVSAIIAGGATGLGAAAAERLAAKGCQIAILDMVRDEGEALAQKLGGVYCHLEVWNTATISAAIDFARGEIGFERVLVNCAGVALEQRAVSRDAKGRVHIHDLASFERLLQLNLTGTFYMAVKAASGMMTLPAIQGMRGVIINSASIAAEDGLEGQAAYAAAEGGVLALTRPLARDLVDEGIRVITIMPGRYDTTTFAGLADTPPPDGMSDPNEFADMVVKLCEDDQYNGQVIRLSGAKN